MSEQEYLDWIKETAKEGIRFNKRIEKALCDAAIEEGTLPDPKQLTRLERNIFAEEANKLGERFSLIDLQAAWQRAKKVIEEWRQIEYQISTMTRAEQEAMLQQQIETLPEELRKLWQAAEFDQAKTKEAVEQVNKTTPLLELTPNLQHWYYIVLQSEYENTFHAQEYTNFCTINGLNYETYKSNKTKLSKKPEFNRLLWVKAGKPKDAHEKVIRAIEKKRDTGWTEPPIVHP